MFERGICQKCSFPASWVGGGAEICVVGSKNLGKSELSENLAEAITVPLGGRRVSVLPYATAVKRTALRPLLFQHKPMVPRPAVKVAENYDSY